MAGETWQRAEFLNEPQLWTWQLWRTEFDLPQGQHEIVVRAWDSAANSQPETIASTWNFKGYVNNAWHRVKDDVEVMVRCCGCACSVKMQVKIRQAYSRREA